MLVLLLIKEEEKGPRGGEGQVKKRNSTFLVNHSKCLPVNCIYFASGITLQTAAHSGAVTGKSTLFCIAQKDCLFSYI